MTSFDIEAISCAELVCGRPQLFTATSSLAEVLTLFSGYEMALRNIGGPFSRIDDSPSAALDWLASECGIQRNEIPRATAVARIVNRFQTEQHAIESVAQYCRDRRRAALARADQ